MSRCIIAFLLTGCVFSCSPTGHRENIESVSGRPISYYLGHEAIPQVCKDLFAGVRKPTDEPEVLALFYSVFTSNGVTNPFYLATVTRTMPKADGAYAEPLGAMAKQFVETRTEQFLDFVYSNPWLDDVYFKQWAQFVAQEVNILTEGDGAEELSKLEKGMRDNCGYCNADQQEILNEFLDRVRIHCRP